MKNYGLSMRNHSLKTNEIIAYTLFTGSCFSLLTLPGNMNCLFIIFISSIPGLLIVKSWLCAEKTVPIPEYHTAETNRTERGKTQKIAPTGNIQRMVDRAAKRAEGKGIGYDRWAAVHNLKQMAATVAAMEQYGFTPDELDAALVSANADLHSSTAKLKPIETAIREKKDLQKQVLAYAKTRDVRDGLKKQKTDKARKAYREKHESDFIIANAAVRYFRQKGITKLPTYKSLQAEIEQLTAEKMRVMPTERKIAASKL